MEKIAIILILYLHKLALILFWSNRTFEYLNKLNSLINSVHRFVQRNSIQDND